MNLYLDTDLLDRLDRWLARQEIRPSKTAAVEAALRSFLDERETRDALPRDLERIRRGSKR